MYMYITACRVLQATRHSVCSKCFPLASTHGLRQTCHWSVMLWWMP